MANPRLAGRTLIGLVAILIVFAVIEALPGYFALFNAGEPRVVAARGALAPVEQSRIALFREARDSVVYITTRGDVFDPFTRSRRGVERGTGSGFVWDAAGHVVTNHHVVEDASAAVVRLADGRSFGARLVGSDPGNDLAVLKISVTEAPPPPLPIGTSAEVEVGQSVLAIGNPFGLDWTLTTGIVSALERHLPREDGPPIRGLIQTDAAINPGNSGGPLLDSAGRLIGVNTAIYSLSGTNAGIGFAVPVDTVNRVVPQLIAVGRYAPPTIGIAVDGRLQEIARGMGVAGVAVLRVEPGSPAAAAGLQGASSSQGGQLRLGDTILSVDGAPTRTVAELSSALGRHRAGDTVELELWREGRQRRVAITLQPG
ncbi:MAG: trypsin-like peptidase domain-containing protein [Pseudomonadota bacterium]